MQLDRDRKAGGAVGELEIDQGEIGHALLDRGERGGAVVGDRGDAVERIELDQMPERLGEQRLVLDDQDAQHRGPSPATVSILYRKGRERNPRARDLRRTIPPARRND